MRTSLCIFQSFHACHTDLCIISCKLLSEGPDLQSDTDGSQISIFATIPSDFLCPLTRQIFNRPVTIETGQTFERHAIVQWFDKGIRMCPITGQELESLSIPDINRVLKRLIDNWKSEHCKTLNSESTCPEKELTATFVENVLSSECETSEKLEKARCLMAIGGIDFLLHKFHGGGEDEKAQAAELLLLCIRAEGSCRNYMAIRICNSSVVQLLHSEVISARSSAVRLLVELLCLKRFCLLFVTPNASKYVLYVHALPSHKIFQLSQKGNS